MKIYLPELCFSTSMDMNSQRIQPHVPAIEYMQLSFLGLEWFSFGGRLPTP
jgi:hypothetical protein